MHLSAAYQITKMLGEPYCNFFHSHYDLKVVKPRFLKAVGRVRCLVHSATWSPVSSCWAIKGLPLPIIGSGEETRGLA